VPTHNDKEVRVGANLLVLAHVKYERPGTVIVAALAEKLERPLVDTEGFAQLFTSRKRIWLLTSL
jgi:hypothetical protein